MRAAAILGPGVSESAVSSFRQTGVEIAVTGNLQQAPTPDAVLLFGGDGTVHRHLDDLVRLKVPLLTVPWGSGNDFAHSLGIANQKSAVRAWSEFCKTQMNLRRIDVGCIRPLETRNLRSETYFCNIGGVGLDSEANRRANAMPRWLRAHGGYIFAALTAIARLHPETLRITSDEVALSEPATLAAFANSPSYGSGMRIAPRAIMDDGKLDVCFVRQMSKLRLLRLFPRVFRGTHPRLNEVLYFQTGRLRIETEVPLDVYADGEFICRTPVDIGVVPRALPVITAPVLH